MILVYFALNLLAIALLPLKDPPEPKFSAAWWVFHLRGIAGIILIITTAKLS